MRPPFICPIPIIKTGTRIGHDGQPCLFKEQTHRLLNNLPDSATWEDVMHRIYVRQAIETGIKDSDARRTVDVKEVRKRFGLST
jgi:hypothetical protein